MYKETQEDYLRSILFDDREDGNEENNYFSSINTQSPPISYSHADQAEELSYDLTNMTLDIQGGLQGQQSYQYQQQVIPQQQLNYQQQQASQYLDNQIMERKNIQFNGFSTTFSGQPLEQQVQPHFQSNFQEYQQQQFGINNQVLHGNSVSQRNKLTIEETEQLRQNGIDLSLQNGQSYQSQSNYPNAYFTERSDGRSNQLDEFYHPTTQQFQPLHVQKLNHLSENLVEDRQDQFQIQPQDFKQEEEEQEEVEEQDGGDNLNKNHQQIGYNPCLDIEQQQLYEYPYNLQYSQQKEQNQQQLQQGGQQFISFQNADQQNVQQFQQQYEQQQPQNYQNNLSPQQLVNSYQPQHSIINNEFQHTLQPQFILDSSPPQSEFSQMQFQRSYSPPNRMYEQNYSSNQILPIIFQNTQEYGNSNYANVDTTNRNNINYYQVSQQQQAQSQVQQLNNVPVVGYQQSGEQIQEIKLQNNSNKNIWFENSKLDDSNLPIKQEEQGDDESYQNGTQEVVQLQQQQQQYQQIFPRPQEVKLKPILIPLQKNFQQQKMQDILPVSTGIQQSNKQSVEKNSASLNNLPTVPEKQPYGKGIHKINHKNTSDQHSKQLTVKQQQDRKLTGKFHKKIQFAESETADKIIVDKKIDNIDNINEKSQSDLTSTCQQGKVGSYDEEENNSNWIHCNGEIQRRRSQSQENLEEVQDKTSHAEDEEEKNSKAEEIAILAESIKHCNKKNVVKNIMSAFLTFMNDKHQKMYTEQEQRYIPTLYNSSPNAAAVDQEFRIDEIRKKFKRYIAQKCLNHYTVRLLILHPNYGPIFKHYLLGPIKKWINNSKVADLAAHTKMIGFFIACYQDNSVLEELKRHEKKRAHFS